MKSHDETLLLSQLLDFHLGRSVERHRGMSDYKETAERFKQLKAAQRDRLRALNERMDKHETNSDAVFRSYEGSIEADELDMKDMEEGISDLRNSLPEGQGGNAEKTVAKFPQGDSAPQNASNGDEPGKAV